MSRQHPVHDTIAALTRVQRQRIEITPAVSYRVEAPCLLQQLASHLATTNNSGGNGIASSKLLLDPGAWDLWTEIQYSTYTWAGALDIDHRPYRRAPQPAADQCELPPVGRLLRLVASTATGRGLDDMADAIHRSATRWHAQIEQMLHGVQEQRGVRGAVCRACEATTVVEDRDDGRYLVPAIVLVQREVAGEPLSWLACLACGWSRSLADPALTGQVPA